jgi:hypothetical protein
MDLRDIQKLPLEDQIEKLKELRDKFNEDKDALKETIRKLEDNKKEKEAHAQSLVSNSRAHKEAEISVIISSVKGVRNELIQKNRELQFLEQAIINAENLVKKAQGDINEEELRTQNLLIEQLMVEKDVENEKERIKRLEELESLLNPKDDVARKGEDGSKGKNDEEENEENEKGEKNLEDQLKDVTVKKDEPKVDYMTGSEKLGDKLYDSDSPDDMYQTNETGNDYNSHPEGNDYVSRSDENVSDYTSRMEDRTREKKEEEESLYTSRN